MSLGGPKAESALGEGVRLFANEPAANGSTRMGGGGAAAAEPLWGGAPTRTDGGGSGAAALGSLGAAINIDAVNGWRQEQMRTMRPWMSEFASPGQFSLPHGWPAFADRIKGNVAYFRSNYLAIGAVLLLFCVIQHLLLTITMVGLILATVAVNALPEDYEHALGGMQVTKRTYMIAIGLAFILLFLFSNFGSIFFWLVGLGGLIVCGHAGMHEVAIESDFSQQI